MTASVKQRRPRGGRDVRGVRVGGRGGGGGEPLGAVAGPAGAAFAGGAIVAGALAAPGGKVTPGRETTHVGADLSDHRLGRAPLHAGDRAEQLTRARERGELLLDLVGEQLDLLVEEVEGGQGRRDDQRGLA